MGRRTALEYVILGEDVAGPRQHPDKEIRAIIRRAVKKGWRVEVPPKGYFKLLCLCAEKHYKFGRVDAVKSELRKEP